MKQYEITYDEFEEKYRPIVNHLDDNASLAGCMFETSGDELEYVLSIANTEPNRVWTYVPDYEPTVLQSGYRLANRIGYIITEEPFEDDTYITVYDPDLEDLDWHTIGARLY